MTDQADSSRRPRARGAPRRATLAAALLALLAPAAGAEGGAPPADTLRLASGEVLTGRVVARGPGAVTLRDGAREVQVPVASVAAIDALEDRLGRVLDQLLVVPQDDADGLFDVVRVAHAGGLYGEAELVCLRILLADPDNVPAHEALGHRRAPGGGYLVPAGTRWLRLEERVQEARDWNRAWELETTHYRARTNLPLGEAIDALLDLERLYLFFYGSLGRELSLRHQEDRLAAHLHGDPSSFPAIGHGRRAYYDVGARRLVVDATSALMRPALLHEGVHQILHVAPAGRRTSESAVPAWLSEGLAEYVANSADGPSGSARFRSGSSANLHAYGHAYASEPVGLTRLLALESGDFLASSDAQLYYAQSWTLVHLCLEGEGGKLRPGFLQFVSEALAGKSSPSAFRDTVAGSADFEARWLAHARELAGAPR